MKNTYLSALAVVACLAVPSRATLLTSPSVNSGSTVSPGNITAATQTINGYSTTCQSFGGSPTVTAPLSTLKIAANSTVVADTCDQTVAVNNGHTGIGTATLREVVAKESGTNTLDFYYQAQFNSNGSSLATGWGIATVFGLPFTANPPDFVGNYSGASLLGTGGSAAVQVVDNLNRNQGAGWMGGGLCTIGGISTNKDCVTFDFNPASLTEVVVISTNDTLFNTTLVKKEMGLNVGNGSIESGTDFFYGYAPTGTVPEPVSIVLLGTILGFTAFFIRRRKSAKTESSIS